MSKHQIDMIVLQALTAMEFARNVLADEDESRQISRDDPDPEVRDWAHEPGHAIAMLIAVERKLEPFAKGGPLL